MFCLLFAAAKAQDTTTVAVAFQAQPFTEFVRVIEAASPYRFYYRVAETDSFRVTLPPQRATVPALVEAVFRNSPFRFIVDGSRRVYLTRWPFLNPQLPPDFFRRNAAPEAVDTTEFAEPAEPVVRRVKTGQENRLFEIGTPVTGGRKTVTLTGYVKDEKTGEPLAGAALAVDSLSASVLTDGFGYYSLALPPGRHVLVVSASGMKTTSRQLLLRGPGRLNVEMAAYVASLKEVVVTSVRTSNVAGVRMGVDRIGIQTIKQVPVVFGEADVLRAVLNLPGVTSVGEANTGLNVRGGAAGQNLILLNDATVYNPSHLFGFFSAFNPDVVKGVELYKSTIPEKYGGRLSSVLDVTTRQGNAKKLSGTAGIGPLTSKLMVEGPLAKNRSGFLASVRTTYSDWLLRRIPDEVYRNSAAGFSDANLHLHHTANTRNQWYLNVYWSNDRFRLNNDTTFRYGNANGNIKWKHNFNDRLYAVTTLGIDRYGYSIGSQFRPVSAYRLSSSVRQTFFRTDFSYTPNLKHTFSFGLNAVHYKLQPGSFTPVGTGSLAVPVRLQPEQAMETALYVGDEFTISSRLSVRAGLRYSVFARMGPGEQFVYAPGLPRSKSTVVDTARYAAGRFVKTYGNPELRLALRYGLPNNASVKLGFNTTAQYIHTVSNVNTVSPVDVFKLSDAHIRPQTGAQLSAGYYQNFRGNSIETSVEVYAKRFRGFLDYKSGAALVLNGQLETDVMATEGKAYGAEAFVKKTSGKLTGWVSYAYSRVLLRTNDPLAGEAVNGGRWYPADFDKPHNTNLTGNYKFSHRYSLSFGANYSTGRPVTLPLAVFDFGGAQRVYYSDRNGFRVPDYFRADLSFLIEGNHKTTKVTHNTWSVGVYNLTARRNVFSVYFIEEGGAVKGYQLSIFGTAIPFLTYTLRF